MILVRESAAGKYAASFGLVIFHAHGEVPKCVVLRKRVQNIWRTKTCTKHMENENVYKTYGEKMHL